MEKLSDEYYFSKILDLSLTEIERKLALADWYATRHQKYRGDNGLNINLV